MTEQSKRMSADLAQTKLMRLLTFGGWALGDRLPGERRLADEVGCNYHTLRKVVGRLVELGILERRQGSGVYLVALPRAEATPSVAAGQAIGVLLTVETGRFFDILLARLHAAAEARDARLVIQPVAGIGPQCIDAIFALEKQGVGAVVIPRVHDRPAAAALIHHSPLPVVLGEYIPGLEDAYFERAELCGEADRVLIARLCDHLQAAGWSRLRFVGPVGLDGQSTGIRVLAFVQEANARGFPSDVVLVAGDEPVPERAVAGDGVGIIAYDDHHALRVLDAARRCGRGVGADLGVIGINNEPTAATADPPLSSVEFDYDHLAEYLVRHALARAAGGVDQGQGLPEHRLVVRESCGARSTEEAR